MALKLIDQAHKLQYFKKVVEAGSIKSGSERAFLSQPHMSKVIQQLEEACGAQLLLRSKSGVEPTGAGMGLYQLSLKLLQEIDQFMQNLETPTRPLLGEIHIGTYDSIARYFFPHFLEFFEARNPKLGLHIKTARSSQIAKDILEGKIDLGIIVNADEYPNLASSCAYSDTFGLYTSNQIQEINNRIIYFDFFKNEVKASIDRFKFYDFFCCDNIETVKSLCEQGLGVGLLPHRVARDGVLSGKLIPFRHPKIKSNFFDEHSIDICFRSNEQKEVTLFVKDEILRFLKIWSKK